MFHAPRGSVRYPPEVPRSGGDSRRERGAPQARIGRPQGAPRGGMRAAPERRQGTALCIAHFRNADHSPRGVRWGCVGYFIGGREGGIAPPLWAVHGATLAPLLPPSGWSIPPSHAPYIPHTYPPPPRGVCRSSFGAPLERRGQSKRHSPATAREPPACLP